MTGEPCGKCARIGAVHDYNPGRCQGHKSPARGGEQCRKAPLAGLTVCRSHGGAAPQAKAAGARRVEQQRIVGEVGKLIADALGEVQGRTGLEHLTDAIEYAAAMTVAYRWLLAELPERSQWSYEHHTSDSGSVQRFVVVEDEGMIGPDQHGNQRLHAYEEGLRYWSKLHGELTVKAMQLGLEDRRQAFAEAQVQAVASAIRHLVTGLGRDLDDPAVVPVVQQALHIVTGARPKQPAISASQ